MSGRPSLLLEGTTVRVEGERVIKTSGEAGQPPPSQDGEEAKRRRRKIIGAGSADSGEEGAKKEREKIVGGKPVGKDGSHRRRTFSQPVCVCVSRVKKREWESSGDK